MADQPERPIEKLLRECGKSQLPSEAFELHPANRRLLQAEVARTYAQKQGRLSWFGPRLLPKLAWGFCAFSVVGLVAWLSLMSNHQTASNSLMARNEKASAPAAQGNAQIASPGRETIPALQSNMTLADNLTTAVQEPAASTALNIQPPPALQTAAPSVASMNLAEQEVSRDAAAKGDLAAATLARVPEPMAPAGATLRYGLASSAAPSLRRAYQSTTVQDFVREQATKAKANEEQPVQSILASFKFERSGSEIRIIDQDGSIYLGSLSAAQSQIRLKAARTDQPVSGAVGGAITETKTASPVASAEEYTFHVTGTNRTLQRLVSFDGRWSTPTNTLPLAQLAKDVNRGIASDRQISAAAPATGRISGTALIKGGGPIDVNAISVQP